MTTSLRDGQKTWGMSRDSEGHRNYTITYKVDADIEDGPANVLQTPGLPVPDDPWIIDDDVDIWAFCLWDAEVKPVIDEPNTCWEVTFKFSTKYPDLKACRDQQVTDPLMEPMKVSGSFVKYNEEVRYDRFGFPTVNSAWEQFRGPQIEFDKNRPQIKIEQNVPLLEAPLFASFVDTLNDDWLWGFPPRCIKLSNVTWERKFHGSCVVYYTRGFEFDIRYDGFDRNLLDEGTKVLMGHWDVVSGNYILDNISGLTSPKAPSLSTDPAAGGLDTGNYGYRISALNALGETLAGPESLIKVKGPTGGVTVTWPAVSGATGYNIYGRTPGAEKFLDTTSTTTYLDTGVDSETTILPRSNTTGLEPDPNNPQHFIHYKDRNGENTRVILNGAGLPAEVTIGTGSAEVGGLYLQTFVSSLGVDPPGGGWVAIESMGPFERWSDDTFYEATDIVYVDEPLPSGLGFVRNMYIANTDGPTDEPPSTGWTFVIADPPGLRNRGAYESTTTYIAGDVVRLISADGRTPAGPPGNIHIEYYNESNFLLLGIPTDF